MLLDRCIAAKNMPYVVIRLKINLVNGYLWCVFDYLISYLSVIKEIFDIVLKAVKVNRSMPLLLQLEQTNIRIKHKRTSFSKKKNIINAIVKQKVGSIVGFLVFKALEGEVCYAK